MTPPLAGTFVGELPAGIALEAAIGFVETVGTSLGGQLRAVLELELAHEARCLVENVAAGHVDVARDSTQCSDDAMQRGGVGADLVDATPREQAGRFARRIHAGGFANLLDGHLGDGGRLVERTLEGSGLELVEAMAPLLDEVVIVEILLDDDARERVRENEIGTGNGASHSVALAAVMESRVSMMMSLPSLRT